VEACAAEAAPAPGAAAAAFDVLQRVGRTVSGTYWCAQCLDEALLAKPDQRAGLVAAARLAEAGGGGGEALRRALKRLFKPTTKCRAAAHVTARNGGMCRCAGELQVMWRGCRACRAARAHPYAGLDCSE
jgi:hypothetical protein